MLACSDRPCLAWLVGESVRFGVTEFLLLSGPLSPAVEKSAQDIAAALPREAHIAISKKPVRAGTGGAI